MLRGLGIADFFATVTISSLAKAAKPAPRIFEAALEKHAMDPEDALHVGDSLREDVEGARKAGLSSVWINREAQTVPAKTPAIQSLTELPALIDSL